MSDKKCVWVRFTINGRSGAPHHAYMLMRAEYLEGDVRDNLVEFAEDIARHNGIGQEYGFRWSYDVVEVLPDRVKEEMIRDREEQVRHATAMLELLKSVPTVVGCRMYDCTDVATTSIRRAIDLSLAKDRPNGPFTVDKETPACEHHAKHNEFSVKNVRAAAERWAENRRREMPLFERRRDEEPMRLCRDGGACHHSCKDGECFREKTCVPLSGSGLNDDWTPKTPSGVKDE